MIPQLNKTSLQQRYKIRYNKLIHRIVYSQSNKIPSLTVRTIHSNNTHTLLEIIRGENSIKRDIEIYSLKRSNPTYTENRSTVEQKWLAVAYDVRLNTEYMTRATGRRDTSNTSSILLQSIWYGERGAIGLKPRRRLRRVFTFSNTVNPCIIQMCMFARFIHCIL